MSRILIVDDNETLGSGVVLMLERMGHEGTAVTNGPEGLARMKERVYDLVITDYRMDEMDGLEVLEAVKARAPETDVMMMTAYGTIEIAVEAMKRGAIDFIAKPFPHDELRLKIEKVLEYRAARRDRERLGEPLLLACSIAVVYTFVLLGLLQNEPRQANVLYVLGIPLVVDLFDRIRAGPAAAT